MPPAASRFRAFSAWTFLLATCALVASRAAAAATEPSLKNGDVSGRTAPTRPGATPAAPELRTSFRVGEAEFVSAADMAVALGLSGTWTEPRRKLTLIDKADPTNRAEIEADGRNAIVNGVRVFLGDKSVLQKGRLYLSRTDVERCLIPLLRPGFGVVEPDIPKVIALDA